MSAVPTGDRGLVAHVLRLLIAAAALAGAWVLAAILLGAGSASAAENTAENPSEPASLSAPLELVEGQLAPSVTAAAELVPAVAEPLVPSDAVASVGGLIATVPAAAEPVVAALPAVDRVIEETVPAVLADVTSLVRAVPPPSLPDSPLTPPVPAEGGTVATSAAPAAAADPATMLPPAPTPSSLEVPSTAIRVEAAQSPSELTLATPLPSPESPARPLPGDTPAPTQVAGSSTPQPTIQAVVPTFESIAVALTASGLRRLTAPPTPMAGETLPFPD